MEISTVLDSLLETDADTIIIFRAIDEKGWQDVNSALDETFKGAIHSLFEGKDFTGKAGETAVLYPQGVIKARRVILSGLGEKDKLNAEAIRRAAATALKLALKVQAKQIAVGELDFISLESELIAQSLVEGFLLGDYNYSGQKTLDIDTSEIESITFHIDEAKKQSIDSGVNIGRAMASGAVTARDLSNLPPNICTPVYLASKARSVAESCNLHIEILERKQMEALKMGALLAVAQGSDAQPRFIILEHNKAEAKNLPTIVLIGKGVTFDTGGYSIKSAEGMVGMKLDMSGAAAVIGAMQTVGMLELPLHVVGLVPAADNMISSKSYRPQEVVTASNDKTIEVISTDAEGRMLLADALVYAKRYNPKAVIDIATLTGSCVVALGSAAAGFFVIDDELRDKLNQAAEITSERIWQLPLFPEYKKLIESNTADMKNSGGRTGGVGTSAVFLQQFVDYPAWAHIDMAGMMEGIKDISYIPATGATGFGARLLAECVRQYVEG